MEAEVLEQERLARPEPANRILGADPERIARARHVHPEELAQALGDRPQAQSVLDLAVGPAEVAGQDDPGALREQGPDRGEGGPDARVIGDLAVLEGNVEVDADEDTLATRVDVADRELVHDVDRSVRRR